MRRAPAPSRLWLTSLLALALAVAACGDDPAAPPTPQSIAASAGTGQTATVGQLLGATLTVVVIGSDDQPLAGASVSWQVTGGGGSVSPASSETDASGVASTAWTLGPTAGAQTVTATVQGLGPVTFTAMATPGEPAEVVVSPEAPTFDALGTTVQLAAEVRDEFGNVLAGAGVAWSSEDEAVATVDAATGLVTGVAVGSAVITATDTGSGLSGGATVEVRQLPATIEVTPADPEVAEGTDLQLTAVVEDANGHEIGDADVEWTSADPAIASVDENGLVTGEAEGSTTITATSGTASAGVTVTVVFAPDDFEPTEDQDVSGTLTVGNLTIPAGVTLTATGDTEIRAFGNVTLAGTLTGDCVAISVIGTGDLTVTGLVENDCSAPTPGDAPDLLVQGGGAIDMVGAEFGSSGATTITNDPALVAAVGAGGIATVSARPAAVTDGRNCSFNEVVMRSTDQPAGDEGIPKGAPGRTGKPQTLACAGTARFEGASTSIFGSDGGNGGDGYSTTSGVPGVGGPGGAGTDAIVIAGGDVVIDDVVLIIRGGDGGWGGFGSAEAYPLAEAIAGDGGRGGLGRVVVVGELRTGGAGRLEIEVGNPGRGGRSDATGLDGEHATDATPARPGGDAMARGGNAANWGGEEGVNLIGDMIQGAVAPGADIMPRSAPLSLFSEGGFAKTQGGRGGDGSPEFPGGARGGHQTAVGGKGADSNVFDNRSDPTPLDGTFPGEGGFIDFRGGRGGDGVARCFVFPVESGGEGGPGGDLVGSTGEGGAVGNVGTATPGDAFYRQVSNGGNGGYGNGPGPRGAGGSDALVIVGGTLTVLDPSLQPGADGNPCPPTAFGATVAVQSDLNGHEEFISMTSVGGLSVLIDEDGNVSVTSGSGIWITVTGMIQADGSFTATGMGTAADIPNVPVRFEGTIQTDEEGAITGIDGVLTVDSTNSVLPPNGEGERNPAIYTVMGTK